MQGRLLRPNCQPMWVDGDAMIFNTRRPTGLWDVWDTQGAVLGPHDGHRGASDVSADGSRVLLTTAYGPMRSSGIAEPGKGFGNDLELYDGGAVRRLTTGRRGIIWARLHPSAMLVVWAELVKTTWEANWWDNFLGTWNLHVADIGPDGLENERVWDPPVDAFVETYGWLADRLMFATDAGVDPTFPWLGRWFAAQLWTMPDTLDQAPTRMSPPFVKREWWGGTVAHNPYHEFMHLAPDGLFVEGGPWVLASICWETEPYGGMDLWRMRPDGSGRERLTWFNKDRYAVVGGLAFDRSDPSRVLAGVAGDAEAGSIDCYELFGEAA